MPPSKNQMAASLSASQAAQAGILTAPQAAEVVTSNSRKQYGFTRKQIPQGLPTEPKVYIFSISDYGEIVNLGPGFKLYEVHACPENRPHGLPCPIDPINFFEEAKVDVTEHTFTSGQQIADAILRIGPGMNSVNDRRRLGWFLSESNPPSEEDVKEANDRYMLECQRLLREANGYASRNQLNEINETHRRAAKYLKQKVDWDKPQTKMMDCPGCGEPVKVGIMWHATPHGCGYVFDLEAYAERFPQSKVPVQK